MDGEGSFGGGAAYRASSETSPAEYLDVFFTRSSSSRKAGQEALQRRYARTEDRDTATTWATREAQYDAVRTSGIPDHAKLLWLSCQEMPVFVANGDSDPMIRPIEPSDPDHVDTPTDARLSTSVVL